MDIQVKSSNGIALVPVDTYLMADRKIFLEGEIDHEQACDFIKRIMILTKDNAKSPIDVLINSPGGSVNAGLAIYDVIQASKVPIRMYVIGRAYSMSALLFISGNHGRYLLEHSELMLHEPLLGNRVGGNASSIQSISDSLLEAKRKMNRILAKHTGKTIAEIEEMTGYDHYFSPEESLESGLADKIIDFSMIAGGVE